MSDMPPPQQEAIIIPKSQKHTFLSHSKTSSFSSGALQTELSDMQHLPSLITPKQIKLLISVPSLKGLVHPKMKILSVFTHPHVVPTP